LMQAYTPTEKTRVTRIPDRGKYDAETVHAILDEGLVCHVGFVVGEQPYVIPTLYARVGGEIYFHGSAASRMLRNLSEGLRVCITVTLIDGLVLARAAFHHSTNYRSVMALGIAQPVMDEEEKMAAMEAFTERVVPGRWADVRMPTAQEMRATTVMRLPLQEVSAKVRTGDPKDEAEDYDLPIWAGVIPLQIVAGAPIPDSAMRMQLAPPEYAVNYSRTITPRIS
jgi:nitroimidazol reductase NimA-like FMN-containing flavoprotein (pyridoxamine 5'-phosphate oxidase superfamily)